jgi:drug/metabolite transporter (DMT)-like permease
MRSPDSLKGIGLTILAMALLPYLDVCAKILGQQNLPIMQVVWARVFFGALFAMPFALKADGLAALVPKPAGYQLLRGLALMAATFCFFTALKFMPIADAMAIFYVQPLLVVVLSALLLSEHIDTPRSLAVVVGFVGTLVVIRPGLVEVNFSVVFPLGAGLLFALYVIITRKLAGEAKAVTTTFQTAAIGAILVSCMLPFVWVWPSVTQWGLMMLMAGFGVGGHYLVTKAYDYAEASLLAPFAYLEILMSIFAGWLFFKDLPDRYTILGVSILIASALYISWRERRLANPPPTSL